MSRYIDADAAIVRISKHVQNDWLMYEIKEAIKNIPTANVRENVKGEWIECDDRHCECPICHSVWSYFENMVEYFDFCPHCGADMRGGEDGNNS